MSNWQRETPQDPEQQIRYTIDLTRQYHNLLVSKDHARQKEQTFYWDGNVAAMEEDGTYSSYLQDDLGSPMHLLDENGEIRESYGYDEFGMPLEGFPEQPLQPFGFTGYQTEEAGGLYFAQARRYDAGAGRFVSEDKIRGRITSPYTLNPYNYCWNRPLDLVDLDGRQPEWNQKGTVTIKLSGNLTAWLGVYVDIGISADCEGNVAVQWSYAVPGGVLDAGVTAGIAFTDAENVDDLLGQYI